MRRSLIWWLLAVTAITTGAIGAGIAGVATLEASAEPNPAGSATNGDLEGELDSVDPVCPRAQIAHAAEPAFTEQSIAADGDSSEPTEPAEPRIVELYPNPTTHGNVGEHLVLETPPETTLENWTLTDGHTTASLPNKTVSGRVALSMDPNKTETMTDHRVLELEGALRLAADGDTLSLSEDGDTIDQVSYDRAPLADRWYRTSNAAGEMSGESTTSPDGQWWPRDATCLPATNADVESATAFVLPDGPDVALETIREAEHRLVLAGYTFTSEDVVDELIAADERGVDVAVLLESGPVGGTSETTEPLLKKLDQSGVDVRATGGEGARYRFHHPKYAIADDHIVVMSENWNPSGVGGESSRGWGVTLEDDELATALETVFESDFEGWDTESNNAYRSNATFVADESDASQPFPATHDPASVDLESAELLVAPDNAEPRLEELLADADEEILLKQASLDADLALVDTVIEAANDGVEVKILLDSMWYNEDDNAAVAASLEQAVDDDASLEARLVEDTDQFEKIHAKGVIIDQEVAVVGSANWNENAFQNNREVLVALHGEAAATYYATVFEADWTGDTSRLPFGLSLTVIVALAIAAIIGHRYIRFGDER
ncbi:phospholipase [Natronolimnobius sp. AArcel1]|uniref:phospholipase D-like domain-containing protein n=1 Tax=Natronolimnobius sp. AArcel1 TaxID=1679093 RepID=UPI0013EB635C|nr:phospholipase D-like domain-containing protein [Natronolimnobius sp. AArcel1]NGM71498.1 phospholipase [Natronolimnobius sp. AArcel1]